MPEEKDAGVSIIELQEEFIQHMERGGKKIRLLSLVATIVGAYFAVSYFVQLVVLPYGLGITSQTVDLVNPGLVGLGILSLAISLLWCYAGVRNLLFERKLAERIREVRELQAESAKKYGLGT
ncbi:MAG: hypothetical protein JRN16_09435 [Nitrososphaerota archaeon]|nr:hypothetical protein [Nitrososphaerota archaeon]MDG6956216.1 hypothetical protein [Nitrososphaerota archaeon]MDG6959918.1 hypothetical protein [Nitrososphaerota archaeon]MDG6966061.1 hypothetical protein [Nitrososphaerota archaeon]MDG6969230.1 hypothetical protein [Nitrososphaerota archaeon]